MNPRHVRRTNDRPLTRYCLALSHTKEIEDFLEETRSVGHRTREHWYYGSPHRDVESKSPTHHAEDAGLARKVRSTVKAEEAVERGSAAMLGESILQRVSMKW